MGRTLCRGVAMAKCRLCTLGPLGSLGSSPQERPRCARASSTVKCATKWREVGSHCAQCLSKWALNITLLCFITAGTQSWDRISAFVRLSLRHHFWLHIWLYISAGIAFNCLRDTDIWSHVLSGHYLTNGCSVCSLEEQLGHNSELKCWIKYKEI